VNRSRQKEFEAFVEVVTSNNGSRLVGNRMYWASDYMVHRRAHYVVSVKGFSTRIANSECVNSENLLVRVCGGCVRWVCAVGVCGVCVCGPCSQVKDRDCI
jgi:hypothetical protein